MNCELCKQQLEAYHEGRLPEGTWIQVKAHLENCKECATAYQLDYLVGKVINEEKAVQPNPFLATRVMAGIDTLERGKESREHIPVYIKVLKTALVTISVAAAILTGVLVGNIYQPASGSNTIPVELTYINDGALESVDLLSDN